MTLTLGLTGMDPATETALKAAFTEANERLGARWRLLPEAEAKHVMVDMDSMYGPMSWLRLHAAGKHVIGLTTATRTQTDSRLGRPFDSDAVSELLRQIASDQGTDLVDMYASGGRPTAPAPARPAAPPESTANDGTLGDDAMPPSKAASAATTPEPTPTPIQQVEPDDVANVGQLQDDVPESILEPEPEPESAPEPEAEAELEPEPAPRLAEREPVLADWLAPGALKQRVRYRRESGPTLLIDPGKHSYHGPSTLKPFAAYFEGTVRREDFTDVDDAAWAAESAAVGAAQPLLRLQWLGGLLAGGGRLLRDHDPDGRYRLTKWPQTEREYPRHFRIATAMMKGPAMVAEIAETSDMPLEDVADFINANLATGFAEYVPETPPEPAEAAKPTGLLGRLRGR